MLTNACKYSPKNAPIGLKIEEIDDIHLNIYVIDGGIGISEEEQNNLFQPFYRKKDYIGSIPGSGLGLTIVKRCIDALGGEISLKSKVNEGTTFIIKLKNLT